MRVLLLVSAIALAFPGQSLAQYQEESDPVSGFAAEFNFYTSVKETFLDAGGAAVSEFDLRAAPLDLRLATSLSESWLLGGSFTYSKLYSINNPPTWFRSNNYVGTWLDAEGWLGYQLVEGVYARGGLSHTYLDRDLILFSDGFQGQVETTHTSPFAGVTADFSHLSSWIIRGHADLLFLTRTNDTHFGDGATTTGGLTGYKTGLQIGYMFTKHVGAFGALNAKVIKVSEGNDGDDRQRRTQWNGYGAGLQFRF